jgi:hypothetical protein
MSTAITRFPLPDDEWADLYSSAKKIPERLRRPVQRAALQLQRAMPEPTGPVVTVGDEAVADEPSPFGAPPIDELVAESVVPEEKKLQLKDISDEVWAAQDDFNDTLILAFVTAWSFGDTVDLASLQNLPGDAYDALTTECQRLNKGDAPAAETDSLDVEAHPTSP